MNPLRANSPRTAPARRFLLLPELPVEGAGGRPRVRRYELASVCTRGGATAAHPRRALLASQPASGPPEPHARERANLGHSGDTV